MGHKGTITDVIETSFKNVNLTGNDIIEFTIQLQEKLEEKKKLSTSH